MYVYYLQESLPPGIQDVFLSKGFYRMHQSLFTTLSIQLDEVTQHNVYWARVILNGFFLGQRHKYLLRRSQQFTLSLHDTLILDEETEALYALYESSANFDVPPTAASFLLGEGTQNFFPTKTWHLRDAGRLIGAGYFDLGLQSAAGILNFYDPAYGKYSLGTLLYLESIRYAKEKGCIYFYPGYIAPGYPKFDYKLLAGKERIEIWNPFESEWVDYHAAEASFLPASR